MKTENEYLLIERGTMARQQRPLTARDRTTSTPSLHKARYIEERPVTSLRRHRACSACIQVSERGDSVSVSNLGSDDDDEDDDDNDGDACNNDIIRLN